ncbi:unnamed protein product [Allacma fusca]|uniref:Uncharacterized protein n=1 Tax=Allacma fusca TaxID=39272 RepID=A0A8J2JIL9_9HEXA|nr:unnamed protein product [Allacma fusca]
MERCVSLLTMTTQWKTQQLRRRAEGAAASVNDVNSLETPVDYMTFSSSRYQELIPEYAPSRRGKYEVKVVFFLVLFNPKQKYGKRLNGNQEYLGKYR